MRTLWTLGVGLALLLMAVGCQQDDGGAGMDQKVGPDGGNGTDLPPDNSLMPPDRDGDATMGDPNNPGPITGVAPPGGPCTCDDQCEGTDTNPGLCVQGVCMQEASSACTSGGSTEQCPAGSQCWGLEGFEESICFPNCDAHTCSGACNNDGICLFTAESKCTGSCSTVCVDDSEPEDPCPPNAHVDGMYCVCDAGHVPNADRTACVKECTSTSCPNGQMCGASGLCVMDIDDTLTDPSGMCNDLPSSKCTAGATACRQLTSFNPRKDMSYWDYPLNGETEQNQWRSYLQLQNIQVLKFAAAATECLAANWEFANGGPIAWGDMSEANGAIPGTAVGQPGHPQGTHVGGRDIDIGYFQTGTPDNKLRPVCAHVSGGADQYHCLAEPQYLDPYRTALFVGVLLQTGTVRVIGMDGRVGPKVATAMQDLCNGGWLPGTVCTQLQNRIVWETTNKGLGWYYHHHHHFHVSFIDR